MKQWELINFFSFTSTVNQRTDQAWKFDVVCYPFFALLSFQNTT